MISIDTSPSAIKSRQMARAFIVQDRASALAVEGKSNKEIGQALDISTVRARHLINVARSRHSTVGLIQIDEAPADLNLTSPETALLIAILEIQISNWAANEVRSVESREVAWKARKSQGWVSSTARKRIATEIKGPEHKAGARYVQGMGLIGIRGNGYLSLTQTGWNAACKIQMDAGIDILDELRNYAALVTA